MIETHPDRDWPEDASHENGRYLCKCIGCSDHFIGHKRRIQCHRCHDTALASFNAMTLEEQVAERRKVTEIIMDWMRKISVDTKP